jgi:hypothetical protein
MSEPYVGSVTSRQDVLDDHDFADVKTIHRFPHRLQLSVVFTDYRPALDCATRDIQNPRSELWPAPDPGAGG